MDPVGATASIVTLAILSKDIASRCRKYVQNVRGAPATLSRFCVEIEALTILFDQFVILQQMAQNTSFCRPSVLTEVLHRAPLLKDYEDQLRSLHAKIEKADLSNVRRRFLFPLREVQILDGLKIVRNIKAILESAMLLDDSFHTRSILSELHSVSTALKDNHGQILIRTSQDNAGATEIAADRSRALSNTRPNLVSHVTCAATPTQFKPDQRQPHKILNWTRTRKALDLLIGRISIRGETLSNSESKQHNHVSKRSRLAIAFIPSAIFCQTVILFQVDWAAWIDCLTIPILNLQFLDIVPDDHVAIRASIRGDLIQLEKSFFNLAASPLCCTKAGWTPLHFAAAYGRTDMCKFLISQGSPLGATGLRGITPLHLAAHFGHLEASQVLVQAGSDPDEYNENGFNAIFELLSSEIVSCSSDVTNFLKWLLYGQEQFLLDGRARDNSEQNLLHHLIYRPGSTDLPALSLTPDRTEAIKFLLSHGVNSDELDIYNISILHKVCRDGRLDLAELLLSSDCCINATDGQGYTPLHYAVESGNFDLVRTLVGHGSDVGAVAHSENYSFYAWPDFHTPLYIAAELNQVETVDFLMQNGANSCDENIRAAFKASVAAFSFGTVYYFLENHRRRLDLSGVIEKACSCPRMIQVLVEAGVSVDEEDSYGWTPLLQAVRNGWANSASKLIELGADINRVRCGLTPLGHAVRRGHSDIAHTLLVAGARTDLSGDYMLPPWQLAISYGYVKIANDIASHGPTILVGDSNNASSADVVEDEASTNGLVTPLEMDLTSASQRGDLEVVEKLLRDGCSLKAGKIHTHSPLYLAINWERWEVAMKLINVGAELNLSYENGHGIADMPFMEAVTHGNVGLVEFMIQRGAQVNISDEQDVTPLLRSLDLFWSRSGSCYSKSDITRVLLSAGARVNVADIFGRTPLGEAAYLGNIEAVVALVQAGADLNSPSSQNNDLPIEEEELVYRTPLAWAAMMGHENVVRFLFDSGAEWRSLRKEPALSYAHRLLMESCFPQNQESSGSTAPDIELLSIPPIIDVDDVINDTDNAWNNISCSWLVRHGPSRMFTSLTRSKKLHASFTNTINCLTQWIRILQGFLQSTRFEITGIACISVLLLVRATLRCCMTIKLANIKLAILFVLIGVFSTLWTSTRGPTT